MTMKKPIALILLFLCFKVSIANTATYYVGQDPGDSDSNSCATAQTDSNGSRKRNLLGTNGGVSCLSAGDTLDIRSGSYNELFDPNGDTLGTVYRQGTSTNRITVRGHTGETVTVGNMGWGWDATSINYWTFDNLIVDGSVAGNPTWSALFTGNSTGMTFKNGQVKNGPRMCVQGFGTFHLWQNVEIFNCGTAGVPHEDYGFYHSGADSTFEYIYMHDVPGYGFHVFNSGSNSVVRNIIRYSRFHDIGGSEPSNAAIIISTGPDNKVYGNVIYNNNQGIQVDYRCHRCEVYKNTIYQNGMQWWGISVYNSDQVIVQNNIIVDHAFNGVHIDNASGTVVSDNFCDAPASGCVSASNGNPQFVDPENHDFRLQSGSPARDGS
jgi:parallel beta-helix repeat protein